MKNIIKTGFYIIIVYVLFSCNGNQPNDNQKKRTKIGAPNLATSKSKFLTIKGDSLKLIVDNCSAIFPKKAIQNYQNPYSGIYTVNKGVIQKTFSLKLNNIIYFTTYFNLSTANRGYLYAFDTRTNKFLINHNTKENYLFSYAGIFFISKEKIFNVYYPYFSDRDNTFIINADYYQVINNGFRQISLITKKGEFSDGDDYVPLLRFYNEGIKKIVSGE